MNADRICLNIIKLTAEEEKNADRNKEIKENKENKENKE